MRDVFVALLGPLEVTAGGRRVQVPGARLTTLLTRLALAAPNPVSAADLVDTIWADDPPVDAANALQSLVSRLRRALGDPGSVVQTLAGYRLVVDRDDVDVHRCADLLRAGRRERASGDLQAAAVSFGAALELWRGESTPAIEPLPDLVELSCDWADALTALGRADETLDRLTRLAEQHPFREDVARSLMRALDRAGRTAEALAAYERLRRFLADELGVDPSAESRVLHLALLEPERVVVGGPDGPGPSNLRAELSSFVGRDADRQRIVDLLDRSRLVTVLGPGGVGKTRLATHTAAECRSRYPDGVWLVELASITDPSGILPALLTAVGARTARFIERGENVPPADPFERLISQLEQDRALLLVDNCEHLIDAVAGVVEEILVRCDQVSVLTTSREPLNIPGEVLAPIQPLALPSGTGPIEESAAVQLFVDRANSVAPGFALDATTRPLVAQIVQRLDGLPLAIELAAARVRVLPLAEVAARLSDRFRLLTGGSRTALPRHRTLRAVVEWSWDLLAPAERLLAERLCVFPAGATEEAARAVTGDGRLAAAAVPDLLAALVDKSLLHLEMDQAGQARYRMLETIREFGVELLTGRGEILALRVAHARYFATFARRLDELSRGREQVATLRRVDADRDNILAALRFLVDAGHAFQAKRLGMSLLWYWTMTGRHAESAATLRLVCALDPDADDPVSLYLRAGLQITELASSMAGFTEDWAQVQAELAVLSEHLDTLPADRTPLGLVMRPAVAMLAGRDERGDELVEIALASGDPWVRGFVRTLRMQFRENAGDVAGIRSELDAAEADFRLAGDVWGRSMMLIARARVRTLDGDLRAAIADYEEAFAAVQLLQTADDDLFILGSLTDLYVRVGDIASARRVVARFRQASTGRSTDRILHGVAETSVELYDNGPQAAAAMADSLRSTLAELNARPSRVDGHLGAMSLAMVGIVEARAGRLGQARSDLDRAYELGMTTDDMPILASVGVAVATLATVLGQDVTAAGMLGAAQRLRGADDPTAPALRWVTDQLRERLGDEYAAAHAAGETLVKDDAAAALDPIRLGEHGG